MPAPVDDDACTASLANDKKKKTIGVRLSVLVVCWLSVVGGFACVLLYYNNIILVLYYLSLHPAIG